MFEFDWVNLLQVIGGVIAGGGLVSFTKAGRAKTKADAYSAISQSYEQRITALHTVIDNQNKTEVEHSQRIADLNHALNEKTDQIRNLTEKMYESEQEVNRVQNLLNEEKDLVVQLTNEHLRIENNLQLELAMKKCEDIKCPFRQPPTADTPPMPDMSKEEYHLKKSQESRTND